ncbi:hypothetical protein [Streptomyces sp. RFCAC02]|uniref:hypothetical protein n=1 Tax=Streptomyces sp. RFCAC02 TaxID=2499143 RepID=UPI0010202098|nr:hypothetical protein [Streptomyces sp. RFCAC02]
MTDRPNAEPSAGGIPTGALAALASDAAPEAPDDPAIRVAAARFPRLRPGADRDSLLDALRPALRHAACPPGVRASVLGACADAELARLGTAGARELAVRAGDPPAMTPALLTRPTAPQAVLDAGDTIDDEVFAAAVRLLPGEPADLAEGEDVRAWLAGHRANLAAWRTLWLRVLRAHPGRHGEIVRLTGGTVAGVMVRELLLGALPWDVEPDVLRSVAEADLARFAGAVLATRVCRLLTAGGATGAEWAGIADELAALPPDARALPEAYLPSSDVSAEAMADTGARGHNAAADWAARAADRWRPILTPARAGERAWRTPPEELRALGQRFARTAAEAVALWETPSGRPRRRPVGWLRDLLLHHPDVTDGLRDGVRAVLAGTRDPDAETAVVERLLADPGPRLEHAPDETVARWLDDHPDDPAAVERALLALAERPGGRRLFPAVLARHPAPGEALRRLTEELPARVTGGAAAERAWARAVTDAPECTPETVRALPAHAALAPPVAAPVRSAVRAALGTDPAAWERFAAGHGGPRLRDLLDTAADRGTNGA